MSKQCPHCYTLNNDDSTFCNKCGTNLLVSQNTTQQPYNQNQINYRPPKQKSTDSWIIIPIILFIIIILFFVISGFAAFLLYLY